MKKNTRKTDALAISVDTTAIIQKTRSASALVKPENLNDLKRNREIYRAAAGYAAGIKNGRVKLLEAAALQLRAEIQIGAVLQTMSAGSDVADTSYEDFLQEQTITSSQALRWRDMGYKMAKKLGLKSVLDPSLKFTPAFFAKFEEYVADCGNDPTGEAVPSFNGFVLFLHETSAAREKRHRLEVLTVFCANLPFLTAETLYKEMRVADHLSVTQADFDNLVWKVILDRRNLFEGQAKIMNQRDKEKTA